MKTYKIYIYILLLSVLLLQFVSIPVAGTHMKPYMMACVIIFPFLALNNRFVIHKLNTFEVVWLITYYISALSIVYAEDMQLGIQLVLGEFILIIFFILFRFLLISNIDKDRILHNCFSFFVYTSLILYVIGCIQVFVFGNSSTFFQELNARSYRVWGCYFEGAAFPRFMGLSESPNNYVYFASTILWWAVWKKKTILAYTSFVTIVLTVSTTAYMVLGVQGILFLVFKRRLSWRFFIIMPLLLYLGYKLTVDNAFIQGMIEVRKVRNETGSGRFELWNATIEKIGERPLLGYGLNQFRMILPSTGKASAHNNILETLISTGVFGLIIYVVFLFSFVKYSIKVSRHYKDPFFILMGVAFVLFGMANNILTIEFVPFILALFCSYGIYEKPDEIED